MREGLLWFDNDPKRSLLVKVEEAVRRYQERFGRLPNCCHLHPEQAFQHPSIVVVPNRAVLRNHIWVGIDEAAAVPVLGEQQRSPTVPDKSVRPKRKALSR